MRIVKTKLLTWGGILVPVALGFSFIAIQMPEHQELYLIVSIVCFILGLLFIIEGLRLARIEERKKEREQSKDSLLLKAIAEKLGIDNENN